MAVLSDPKPRSATAVRDGKATSRDGKINLNLSRLGRMVGALIRSNYSTRPIRPASAARLRHRQALRNRPQRRDINVTATVNLNKDESGSSWI